MSENVLSLSLSLGIMYNFNTWKCAQRFACTIRVLYFCLSVSPAAKRCTYIAEKSKETISFFSCSIFRRSHSLSHNDTHSSMGTRRPGTGHDSQLRRMSAGFGTVALHRALGIVAVGKQYINMILLMTGIELLIYLSSSFFAAIIRVAGSLLIWVWVCFVYCCCWCALWVPNVIRQTVELLALYLRICRPWLLTDNYDSHLIFTFLPYDETEPFRLCFAIDLLWPSNSEHSKYNQGVYLLRWRPTNFRREK